MNISARNIFKGTVASIANGAVNAEITITLASGASIISTVTLAAVEQLGLAEGMAVRAIVKTSTIILDTDLHDAKVSARNKLCSTVTSVTDGVVNTEVALEIGSGDVLSAVITRESAKALELIEGSHACAIFKAPSVIIGVE